MQLAIRQKSPERSENTSNPTIYKIDFVIVDISEVVSYK